MINFLLLSLLSGVIELGSVLLGIKLGVPVAGIILFPFWYQLGNLLMSYLPRKKSLYLFMLATVILGTIINSFLWSYIVLAIQLVITSYCIQAAREKNKKSCPTWLKRSFRIGGFAISAIFVSCNGQIILIASIFFSVLLLLRGTTIERVASGKKKYQGISLVMIFHQIHYFVYTYIMPIYLYQNTKSFIAVAIAFAITWIVYLSPQVIVEKSGNVKYKKVFFVGHSFLAVCLGLMAWMSRFGCTEGVLCCWLLTGFGGGTVFCIKHLCSKYEKMNMDLSENIGHVVGPFLAVCICYYFPNVEITVLAFGSCISVVIALLSAIIVVVKERKNG